MANSITTFPSNWRKKKNCALFRTLLVFCLVFLWGHLVFGKNVADKVTMTALLVHSWFPELGKLNVETGSIDQGLSEVAGLVLHGDFKSAEGILNGLEGSAPDNRAKVLILLWRRELEQRRYLFLSGGAQIFGAPMLDMMKRELVEKKRDAELHALIRQMSPDDARDSQVAAQYGLFFSSLDNGPGNLRSRKLFAETKETDVDDSAVTLQEQLSLKAIEDNGRVAVQLDLLGGIENQLSMHILKGQLAAARRDFDTARIEFQAGLEQASQAGLQQCAAEFMLRLGDLEAIPYGDALTFGYNCLSEGQVRLMIKSDITPSVRRVPSAQSLAASEVWYNKAGTAFEALPQSASRHRLKFRWAHLARMRGDSTTAIQLYQEAAKLARQENAWTAAAVADASTALLLGSRTLFLNSMKSLKDRGDMGAALSVAQVAHSVAARNWYVLHNFPQAIAIFRMLADALVDNNFDREAVDPLFDLAWLASATWRSEMSIEVIQEAANEQRRYLTQAEKAEREYEAETSSLNDEVGLSHERDLLGFLLTQLLGELDIKVTTEGATVWLQQREKVNDDLIALGSISSSITSDSRTRILSDQNESNKIQYEVGVALQDKKCENALLVFNEGRSRASKLNNPLLLIHLDAMASRCDSKLINQARGEMEAFNPMGELRKALASRASVPSLAAQLSIRRAVGNLQLLSNVAATLGVYDLLTNWFDDLDSMIRNDPTLQGLGPMSQGFRAISLLGQNHPDQARDILNKLASDERLWAVADPDFRISILGLLVEAESVLGDLGNAENGLLALERLRFEQAQQQQIRSGVFPALRMSAEQAMLEREVANTGRVTPQQAIDLRRLRNESAQFANPATQAPRLSDLRSTLTTMPAKTTVLVYHIGPRAITLWRASREQPVKMLRLKVPLKDTLELITKLQGDLVKRYSWQNESSELYKRLIPEAEAINAGDTIAVVATGVLARLPFEILGLAENSALMQNHAIVYVNRLCGGGEVKSPTTTIGHNVLVAGLNSFGLKQAENEARSIGDLLHAEPLLGPRVTNQNVVDKLKSANWVHLATHANVELTNPYTSYLLLADGQRMEAWELFRYAPQAEMIVLSACNTKTDIQPLIGPISLTTDANSLASFAFAGGAKWVLASLWSADDLASSTLMRDFYSNLTNEHLDPPRALQKARKNAASKADAQPYYYAQFLLSARNLAALQ